jgi:hypothetical protein
VQYGDYAAWQRGWLRGEALEAQLAWWRQQLAGVSQGLELPTDRPRPALATHHGAVATHRLEPALAEALHAFHRRERVTPFMTYLAALQAVLHRYSGQDDVTVGTPVSGRVAPAMEDLIGLFVNTLVLRSRLEPRCWPGRGRPRSARSRTRTCPSSASSRHSSPSATSAARPCSR